MEIRKFARLGLLAASAWGTLATLGCGDRTAAEENPSDNGGLGGSTSGSAGKANASGGMAGSGIASGGTAGGGGRAGGGGQSPQAGNGNGGGAPQGGGGAGGDTNGGTTPAVDCSAVPTEPTGIEPVLGARGYHGIVFDAAGNLIGVHDGTIYKTTSDGVATVLAAGFSQIEGLDVFPNGDLLAVAADDQGNASLTRITMAGAQQKLLGVSFTTYGVRVVPSGWIYFGEQDGLQIFNPASKQVRSLAMPVQPRVLDYSPDHKTMYVGTLTTDDMPPGSGPVNPLAADQVGLVYQFDLDAAYLPLGKPRLFASKVGGGYHDGLGVDACGNLFVADFQTSGLYRVTSDGKVSLYHQWKEETYGHSLAWGSGVGGWDRLTLYQPQPYNNDHVVKLVAGVPSRPR